jgi:hypothetical protein
MSQPIPIQSYNLLANKLEETVPYYSLLSKLTISQKLVYSNNRKSYSQKYMASGRFELILAYDGKRELSARLFDNGGELSV